MSGIRLTHAVVATVGCFFENRLHLLGGGAVCSPVEEMLGKRLRGVSWVHGEVIHEMPLRIPWSSVVLLDCSNHRLCFGKEVSWKRCFSCSNVNAFSLSDFLAMSTKGQFRKFFLLNNCVISSLISSILVISCESNTNIRADVACNLLISETDSKLLCK